MGFRSTLVSQYYGFNLPDWFKEKYSRELLFPNGTLIVSKIEAKYYDNEMFEDYKKALNEIGFFDIIKHGVKISVLAEDGVITKVTVYKDSIRYDVMCDSYESDRVWQQ